MSTVTRRDILEHRHDLRWIPRHGHHRRLHRRRKSLGSHRRRVVSLPHEARMAAPGCDIRSHLAIQLHHARRRDVGCGIERDPHCTDGMARVSCPQRGGCAHVGVAVLRSALIGRFRICPGRCDGTHAPIGRHRISILDPTRSRDAAVPTVACDRHVPCVRLRGTVTTPPTTTNGVVRMANGGDAGNRTRIQGFAGPCLSHSATSPCVNAIVAEPSMS